MDIQPPKLAIAGIDLVGRRQPNGTLIFGVNGEGGQPMEDWPAEIYLLGINWTLEEVKHQREHKLEEQRNVEWGVYV